MTPQEIALEVMNTQDAIQALTKGAIAYVLGLVAVAILVTITSR